MRPAAAVTMVYNERENFPRWLHHYSAQVGMENCFVMDHGSDDDTFAGCPIHYNLIHLPRTAFHPILRGDSVADFVSSLAPYYRYVIYADADELIVSDPLRHADLASLCETLNDRSLNSIGFDICHRMGEAPLDRDHPISLQRTSMRFNSAMCKPNIVRPGVRWSPGFHGCDNALKFGDVYLFHTHWADRAYTMARLKLTRALALQRTDPYAADHWQAKDEVIAGYLDALSVMPVEEDRDIGIDHEEIRLYLDRIMHQPSSHEGKITPPLDLLSDHLFHIPKRLKGRF